MRRQRKTYLDVVIDLLTNSIQNTISGDSFATDVIRLTKLDLTYVTQKFGWNFDWKKELYNNTKEVYKLIIKSSPDVIQGLISISVEPDHIFVNLVESAPFNVGKVKLYEGVPGNL